jgi:hypothetical protein
MPGEAERTPLVEVLLARIEQLLEEQRRQAELIGQLRDEIAILKGEKAKPKFKPSGMEQETEPETSDGDAGAGDGTGGPPKRPGSAKRRKTVQLTIHETVRVTPGVELPAGSRFKGYRDFVVQDLRIAAHNTRYRLEVWQTPDGERLVGTLPSDLHGGHFGAELRRYVLYQHHHCQVTQPLLHEQLREWGIDISTGQIDALLSGHTTAFLAEKDQLLTTGLAVSRWITVDDSGARHQGRNGYVTQIGNDWFAWFAGTHSKSRINFLQLLQAGERRYTLNAHALEYWCEEGLPAAPRRQLQSLTTITGTPAWEAHLDALGITSVRHRRIATEGALLGGLIEKGFSLDLAIVSDGAGQFAILLHALCWVHAERLVHKLIPLNDRQRADQAGCAARFGISMPTSKPIAARPIRCCALPLEERFDATLHPAHRLYHPRSHPQAPAYPQARAAARARTPRSGPAHQRQRRGHPRLREMAKNQRRHPQRSRQRLSRRLRQLEEDLPQAGHLVLGLSRRPHQTARDGSAVARPDPRAGAGRFGDALSF